MGTYFSQKDLDRLRDLRSTLLGMEDREPGDEAPRYWRSERDIELYDRVFGARIGWKWDAVLGEIQTRHGLPKPVSLLDWGTGTGVAARRALGAMPGIERVRLYDRDPAVLEYARQSLAEGFPAVEVEASVHPPGPGSRYDLMTVSHVLDELGEEGLRQLTSLFEGTGDLFWVEPGSKRTSRALSSIRETLTSAFWVLGPCVHQESCGMLTPSHKKDWCHLFAKPPAEVHTTGEWSEIHRELRIDLRSLPYSFLALRNKVSADPVATEPGARVLGRPRFQRGRVLLDLCDSTGVREGQMLQRTDKAFFKELKKASGALLFVEETEEGPRPSRFETP